MPYISNDLGVRDLIEAGDMPPQSAGQLAFALTLPIRDFLRYVEDASHGPARWNDLADVVKALEAVKVEFERRVLGPYEDTKIEANGDVDWGV